MTAQTASDSRTHARTHAKRQGASGAEAARHFSVDPTTIRDWERRGWLVRHEDRSIDLDATAASVDAHRDPTMGGRRDRGLGAKAPRYSTQPQPKTPGLPDRGAENEEPPDDLVVPPGMDPTKARTRKEYWQSIKAEMEARQLAGKLVPLAEARRTYVETITRAKTDLEALPVRAAPKLVGLTDEKAVRDVLRAEVAKLLRGLSDEPPVVASE